MFTVYYSSPIGQIKIDASESSITQIHFDENISVSKSNKVLQDAVKQLDEYFLGKRISFDLSVEQLGTSFQKSVWKELMNIPYGETVSYGELARKIGNEKAVRAVGAANGRNKLPIIIPCHRVVGHNGKAVGFAYGIERKMYLLNHERNNSKMTQQLPLYV